MELRELRVFQRVADVGSLQRAAESLGVTQPALSKTIRRLEAGLGVRLFERTARGVALTSIGKVLYDRNAALLQAADEIPREMDDLRTGTAHQLRVGCMPSLVEEVLCPALVNSIRANDSSVFSVRVELTGTLVRELSAGQLDFALLSLQDDLPTDLAYTVLGEQRVYVVSREDHPLQKRSFEPSELTQYPWVLPSSDFAPHRVKMVFNRLGLEAPKPTVKTDSGTLVLSALIADCDALTVMTASSLAARRAKLKPLPLPVEYSTLTIALCWRRAAYISQPMRRFRENLALAFAKRRIPEGYQDRPAGS